MDGQSTSRGSSPLTRPPSPNVSPPPPICKSSKTPYKGFMSLHVGLTIIDNDNNSYNNNYNYYYLELLTTVAKMPPVPTPKGP